MAIRLRKIDKALKDAIEQGYVNDIETYIAAGANPNATSGRYHEMPLRHAMISFCGSDEALTERNRKLCIAMVKKLLSLGADANGADRYNTSLLHAAVNNNRTWRHEIVELLIAHHADIHAKDKNGNTPLMVATKAYYDDDVQLKCVQMLLNAGANPLEKNKRKTAVQMALKQGNHRIAALLEQWELDNMVKADNANILAL